MKTSVSHKGSHVGMLLDVAIPDTMEAEKKGCQEASPARRVHQALPDDIVIEDEDEVLEDSSDAGEVFLQSGDVLRPPVPAGVLIHPLHPHVSASPHIKPEDYDGTTNRA